MLTPRTLPLLFAAALVISSPGTSAAQRTAQAVTDSTGALVSVPAPSLLNRASVVRALAAKYPPALRDAGVSGRVMVKILIGPDGVPAKSQIAAGSGEAALDSAALAVVAEMRFTPTEVGGQRVPVWVDLPLAFEVPPKPAPAASATPAAAPRAPEPPPAARGTTTTAALPGKPELTYDLGEVDEQPRLANRDVLAREVSRRYPEGLRAGGIDGDVMLRIRVDEQGRGTRPQIQRSSGFAEFDAAAVEVASFARFRPAKIGGRPVPVWVTLPVSFRIYRGEQ